KAQPPSPARRRILCPQRKCVEAVPALGEPVAISEQQLETWAKQGPTAQFTATYGSLKGVLNESNSPHYSKDYTVLLQGSYKKETNVYGDSDVDVIMRLNQTFYTDLDQLSEED